ncbi:hypothetical protein C7M46_01818 (plasmid) [Pediococcus pentosaceus]|uniref:restriction endonuclease subunit S n=1 Tax=Pediococcus pentosaceus TaxID=1255 RepID=UPI0013641623|nr:restriction endonuclease subunit S [Pediococcus pentosaceus]QHM61104.1 hypothetical protein C7M46_01818 [Pediococcus pentosaceus]
MKDNQAKYPQLRFKGFTDPWEQRKLENIFNIIDGDRGSNYPHNSDFLENGTNVFLDTGNVRPSGFLFNTIKYISNGKDSQLRAGKMEPNDIVMTSRGTLGNIAWYTGDIVDSYPSVRINSAMLILRNVIPNEVSTPFMISILRGNLIDAFMRRMKVGSAQPHITKKDFSKTEVSIPSNFKEQESLGMFFETLDNLISANQRKLDLLKEQKKGYLQKMFPKNGAKVPELRFAGFADDWEQRKSSAIFHTITDFVANGSFASLRENVSYSDKLDYAIVVRLTDYSNGYKGPFLYTSKSGYDFLKKSSLNPNDILISNVGANAGLVFKAPILDVPMTLGPNSILVRTSDQDREFMYQLMRSTTGEHLIKTQIGISAQPKFNKTEFKQIIFTIPKSQEEQQKIGNLFHELDHTIALHQRKLEKLQELKKGYLQKMFC